MHTAHAESSAKVDEREREREGARAKTRARARWTYFRVTPSLFLTRTRRRTVASVRRRVLGDRAATRQWFTIVRRGAFGRDDTRFIRGSIGGVERWEEFSFVRLPRRRVERYPKTRRRFRASSHRDRVACVNDSTAISSFHCLSARSRATRGRSRRWGRETTPHREGEKITRSRAGTGNRAGIERATGVARRTPAPRPPLCVDRVRLPINIRSSSRVNRFESSHRGVAVESTNSPRVPLNSFSSPSPLDARALAVCRLFSRAFRSSRSFVPSASPSVVFPVPRVVLPPLPPPRFPPRLASVSSPGRARCRDIGIFIRSFGWTRCSVLRVMTRECTRAQTTTSYDSRYMECTPGYIRWRSSRRLESRPPRSRRSSRAIDGARTRFRPRRSRAIVRSFVRSFVPSRRSSSTLSVSDVHTLDRENHRPRGTRRRRRRWDEIVFELLTVLVRRAVSERTLEDVRDVSALAQVVSTSETKETKEMTTRRDRDYVGSCPRRR